MRFVLSALALFSITCATAQPVQTDYKALEQKYKGYPSLVLNREQHLRIGMGGKEKLKIESDHVQQIYYIDNKQAGYTERKVPYAPGFYTIKKIEANTWLPEEKGKFKKVPVTTFKDENQVDNGSVFYDGIVYRKFQLSSLGSGVISETKYTYSYDEPGMLGGFYFMWGVPNHQVKYSVTVSDDVTIGYTFMGDSSFLTKTVVRNGKNTVYTWEAKDVPALKSYDDAVNDRYFEPHLFVYVKSYKTKKGWEKLFGTPADLYHYDYKFISKVNAGDISPALRTVVDSIKSVAQTELEVMRGVYYWVQQNMRYIAFEDGLGGQVPREANDIFVKRYGDCKDLSSLITFMLKAAGIRSYLGWTGSRDLPYTFEQLPLGYSTNHMIAVAHDGKDWIFIDGTSKHTPFGVPSGFIQGKEVMISVSPDSFVIARAPVMPPTFSNSSDSIYLKIENDVIKGNGVVTLYGYNRSYMVDRLYYTGIDKLTDQLKNYMSLGNNKCEVTSVEAGNYSNNDSPLVVHFTFTLPSYLKVIDNELYMNMHLRKIYLHDRIDTSGQRIAPRDLDFTYNDRSVFVLEVPKGYEIKKIPDGASDLTGDLHYSVNYTKKGNLVIFTQANSCDKLMIGPDRFEQWNKQIDALLRIYKDNIILTKKSK
jgi:transglutaminase-like putative cysteine protease